MSIGVAGRRNTLVNLFTVWHRSHFRSSNKEKVAIPSEIVAVVIRLHKGRRGLWAKWILRLSVEEQKRRYEKKCV